VTDETKITINDLREFLQMFMRPQDYERMILLLKHKKEFRLPFRLIQKIGEVEQIIIVNKNNNFAVQFIPESVASAPMSDAMSDTLVPDVIVFVDK